MGGRQRHVQSRVRIRPAVMECSSGDALLLSISPPTFTLRGNLFSTQEVVLPLLTHQISPLEGSEHFIETIQNYEESRWKNHPPLQSLSPQLWVDAEALVMFPLGEREVPILKDITISLGGRPVRQNLVLLWDRCHRRVILRDDRVGEDHEKRLSPQLYARSERSLVLVHVNHLEEAFEVFLEVLPPQGETLVVLPRSLLEYAMWWKETKPASVTDHVRFMAMGDFVPWKPSRALTPRSDARSQGSWDRIILYGVEGIAPPWWTHRQWTKWVEGVKSLPTRSLTLVGCFSPPVSTMDQWMDLDKGSIVSLGSSSCRLMTVTLPRARTHRLMALLRHRKVLLLRGQSPTARIHIRSTIIEGITGFRCPWGIARYPPRSTECSIQTACCDGGASRYPLIVHEHCRNAFCLKDFLAWQSVGNGLCPLCRKPLYTREVGVYFPPKAILPPPGSIPVDVLDVAHLVKESIRFRRSVVVVLGSVSALRLLRELLVRLEITPTERGNEVDHQHPLLVGPNNRERWYGAGTPPVDIMFSVPGRSQVFSIKLEQLVAQKTQPYTIYRMVVNPKQGAQEMRDP